MLASGGLPVVAEQFHGAVSAKWQFLPGRLLVQWHRAVFVAALAAAHAVGSLLGRVDGEKTGTLRHLRRFAALELVWQKQAAAAAHREL